MFYIEKNDKPNFIEKKLKILRVIDNTIMIPSIEEIEKKQIEKIALKTIKIIKKYSNSTKVVVSKEIKQQPVYINYINKCGIKISDGKLLFEILLPEITEYIIENKNIEKANISILINDLTDLEFENIKILARKYNSINIVTNHIEKFKKLQKSLDEDEGIIITITNNKKRSLMKAEIILNIDFPKELINKFNIKDDAIIVNVKEKISINKKRFNGININDYEIDYREDRKQEKAFNNKYYLKDIYESELYKNNRISEIRKKVKSDKVKIKKLILNNGEI